MRYKLRRIRFRLSDFQTITRDGRWLEVTGYVPIRRWAKRKPARPPESGSVIVSEDGCFVYVSDGKYWVCPLTPDERKLVQALGKSGGSIEDQHAFTLFWPSR